MLEGTYIAAVDTPLGKKNGTIKVAQNGNAVTADIDAPVVGKRRIEGRADGDSFTAQGELNILLMGKVSYTVEGRVQGDAIEAAVRTGKGDFTLRGTRA